MEQSKKKYLAPVGALLLALLLVTVITFPMLSMEVKDIPVAVFSQDEGMQTPNGTVNAGETMVKQITKSGNKALDWDVLKSKQEVQDALDEGAYYAVFTIPQDFTKTAAMGGEKTLKVTLDQGKNPLVSNSLTSMLTAMSEQSGMKLQTEIIHSTADYGMLAMFLPGFWDAAVASWETLRYFGEGLRTLLYQGSGLWNCATVASIVLAAVGVAVSLIAVVREKKYWETAGEKQ